MDHLGPKQRSRLMARVRARDTKPEQIIRRLVYSLGYRYRLHVKELPGSPDLVFKGRRKVIFVHGCFWHRHRCRRGRIPTSRIDFWTDKLEGNKLRDRRKQRALARLGWRYLIVWECELTQLDRISKRVSRFLTTPRSPTK